MGWLYSGELTSLPITHTLQPPGLVPSSRPFYDPLASMRAFVAGVFALALALPVISVPLTGRSTTESGDGLLPKDILCAVLLIYLLLATFFAPGLGACGQTSDASDLIVAVSQQFFDTFPCVSH